MIKDSDSIHVLQSPLELPCGAILKNRLAKSPMPDSLADGAGNPTEAQIRLYERWAEGGVALSFIGEVRRIVLEVISEVRRAVGPLFPVGIRINSTDMLEGGLTEVDALAVVRLLDQT